MNVSNESKYFLVNSYIIPFDLVDFTKLESGERIFYYKNYIPDLFRLIGCLGHYRVRSRNKHFLISY
jgi:hypothetical protein